MSSRFAICQTLRSGASQIRLHNHHQSHLGYRYLATMQPRFAEGVDTQKAEPKIQALIENGWELSEDAIAIDKTFYFKTYTKVLDFHHIIGVRSKSKNHHAIMTSEFGSLKVHWTTHHPHGLTELDIDLANYCDEQAAAIGTVEKSAAVKCGPSK